MPAYVLPSGAHITCSEEQAKRAGYAEQPKSRPAAKPKS